MTQGTKLSRGMIIGLGAVAAISCTNLLLEFAKTPTLETLGQADTLGVNIEAPLREKRTYRLEEAANRPLFSEDRLRVVVADTSSVASADGIKVDTARLEAVIGSSEGLMAGLRFADNPAIHWVQPQDVIEEWTVKHLDFETIHLSNGSELLELSLYPSNRRPPGE